MSKKQQDWLTEHLINSKFNLENTEDLIKKISGMTAQEIIESMEAAKLISDRLNSTSLGKELS